MNQTTAPDLDKAIGAPQTSFPRVMRLPVGCPLSGYWAPAMAVGVEGAYYTASLTRSGRIADTVEDSVMVHVTPRGHWYRSDDLRSAVETHHACRGCGRSACFDFTIDMVRCPKPPTAQDIASALLASWPRPKPAYPASVSTLEFYRRIRRAELEASQK